METFVLGVIAGILVTIVTTRIIDLIIVRRHNKERREFLKNEIVQEIIKEEQDKVWKNLTLKTDVGPQALAEVIIEMIKKISGLYYKDSPHPEMEATIEELLLANIELSNRLLDTLDQKPFNILKQIKLSHIYYTKNKFNDIKDSTIYKQVERYSLWKNWKRLLSVINAVNPQYWFAKGSITFSKEFLFRLFRSYLVGAIGEEADKTYGGRLKYERKNKESDKETKEKIEYS